ncbi:MAG: cobalt ECF transporter T component CbiQ [Caldilineaceae bacterium]|nr:cobalt ECF transporter T component CbiQ [Caldilineaceae bacterium]
MHTHFRDQYRPDQTLIHQLDPRVKVVLALLFILTVSLTPFGAYGAYGALWLFVLMAAQRARIAPIDLLKRSVVALPFALAAVTLPFTVPGQPLLTLPLFGGLVMSVEGVVRFVSILIKSWLSLQMALILVTVTPFPALLWALRSLHVPAPLISIVTLLYRYLFLLYEEVMRLLRARAARSAAMDGVASGGSLIWRGQVAGRMAGSLMLRSFERSERIYTAMVARGYRGQLLTLEHSHFQRTDWLVAGVTLLFLFLVLFLAGK